MKFVFLMMAASVSAELKRMYCWNNKDCVKTGYKDQSICITVRAITKSTGGIEQFRACGDIGACVAGAHWSEGDIVLEADCRNPDDAISDAELLSALI